MKNQRLQADRLAQAFADAFPQLADLKTARRELDLLAGLVRENKDLRRILANPVVPPRSKEKAMQALAERIRAGKPVRVFLAALGQAKALRLLPEISPALGKIVDRREGIHEVKVTSASPIDPAVRDRLMTALTRLAGGGIRLMVSVDPTLLGGLIVEMSGTIYDGSLKTSLGRLKSEMLAGAVR